MEAVDVISYPDESVLLTPEKAWELFNTSDFRITTSRIPFEPSLIICDIRIAKRMSEDKLYETKPSYLYNLRRGISFIISKDKCDKKLLEENELLEGYKNVFIIARKGLHKFFDITPEYLDEPFKLPNRDNKANYIFWPLKHCFEKDGKVEIYSTRKANGENAQVSYNSLLGMWCIASKNVALCVRDIKDLAMYSEDRYKFSIAIANVWLKIIEDLRSRGQLEEFKKSIDNKTLIGEYVGNNEYQHLVAYNKETIMFYAMVDNNLHVDCVDPEKALSLFKHYGLDYVSYKSLGVFNSLKELRGVLLNSYIDISGQSLYSEEEGSVMYLVKRGGEEFTFSLCKIKTLEYRLYRKLRENLRRQLSKSLCTLY